MSDHTLEKRACKSREEIEQEKQEKKKKTQAKEEKKTNLHPSAMILVLLCRKNVECLIIYLDVLCALKIISACFI